MSSSPHESLLAQEDASLQRAEAEVTEPGCFLAYGFYKDARGLALNIAYQLPVPRADKFNHCYLRFMHDGEMAVIPRTHAIYSRQNYLSRLHRNGYNY